MLIWVQRRWSEVSWTEAVNAFWLSQVSYALEASSSSEAPIPIRLCQTQTPFWPQLYPLGPALLPLGLGSRWGWEPYPPPSELPGSLSSALWALMTKGKETGSWSWSCCCMISYHLLCDGTLTHSLWGFVLSCSCRKSDFLLSTLKCQGSRCKGPTFIWD